MDLTLKLKKSMLKTKTINDYKTSKRSTFPDKLAM